MLSVAPKAAIAKAHEVGGSWSSLIRIHYSPASLSHRREQWAVPGVRLAGHTRLPFTLRCSRKKATSQVKRYRRSRGHEKPSDLPARLRREKWMPFLFPKVSSGDDVQLRRVSALRCRRRQRGQA